MVDVLGSVTGFFSGFSFLWVVVVLVIALFVSVIASIIRGRVIYKYPVRIFRARENGTIKEFNCKGGYIGRKNSASFFQIKTGRFPWQKINLNTTPMPKYMDQDNRVYYKQIDLGTYIQLQRIFIEDEVRFAPVEQDVKYGAILDIHRIKEVLRTDSTWKKVAPYMALVIIFMAAILGWWFVMNSKCPSIG
jgi:hypothetical protein